MEWHIPLPEISSIKLLDQKIIACRKCPRLVDWREEVAVVKRKSYENEKYWGKPVPGFGPDNAGIVIVGLAPGAHGANRIGFTKLCTRTGLQQFQPVDPQMMDNNLLTPVLLAQFDALHQITSLQLKRKSSALTT
jgi:hypothetical protein